MKNFRNVKCIYFSLLQKGNQKQNQLTALLNCTLKNMALAKGGWGWGEMDSEFGISRYKLGMHKQGPTV